MRFSYLSPPALESLLRLTICLAILGIGRLWAGEITYTDGRTFCRLTIGDLRSSTLHQLIEPAVKGALPDTARRGRASRLLDSLGYFHPKTDTIKPDTVRIDAGKRSIVASLKIEGPLAPPLDSIEHPPIPFAYDAGSLLDAGRAVLRYFGRHGHPFASMSTAIVPDSARPQILAVVFTVDPDQACRFAPPVVTGALKTRRRQLDQDMRIRPGAEFNIDKLDKTRDQLLSREYIAAVTIGAPRVVPPAAGAGAAPGAAPLPGAADTASVAVPIQITDRSGMGLDGALALSNDQSGNTRLTGALDFSLLNMLGWGEKATLSFKGDQSSERLNIALSKVHWFDHPITTAGNFDLEVQTNEFGDITGGLELLYEIRPRWQVGVGLKGEETTVSTGAGETRQFGGSNFILARTAELPTRGNGSREFSLVTGIGLADRPEGTYTRWHIDFSTGGEAPVFGNQAIGARFTALNLFTNEDTLASVELYRLGGYQSVRGYDDEQFAFRNAAYAQLEYLAYFSAAGAVYAFCDGGVGFPDGLTAGLASPTHDYIRMLGYGVGMRVPVKIGSLSLEWARNIDDTRSLGRINVRVQNGLTSATVGRY